MTKAGGAIFFKVSFLSFRHKHNFLVAPPQMGGATYLVTIVTVWLCAGLPRVREKSGKNKIFSRSGNCQGILKKCQGILSI